MDSGNLLFQSAKLYSPSSTDLTNARGIADIYAKMNYDAVNIGSYDLSAGLPFVQELFFLPWVSANFYDANNQPLFQPYIMKSIGELKVGIIGLSPNFNQQLDNVHYRSWQEVLPEFVLELQEQADLIILLSSLEMKENRKIALSFPIVRLIVTAIPGWNKVSSQQEGETLIIQTQDRGRYLGYLFLQNPEQEKWQNLSISSNASHHQKSLRYRLQRIEMALQKRDNIPEQERKRLLKEKSKLSAQLNRLNTLQSANAGHAGYRYVNIPISPNIPPNEGIERLVEQTQLKSANTGN